MRNLEKPFPASAADGGSMSEFVWQTDEAVTLSCEARNASLTSRKHA
jgi:hypothetical protein